MNFLYKINHYLKPYILLSIPYKINNKAFNKKLSINYWIEGYGNNIINNKWKVENGIPLGLYTQNKQISLHKKVHISGLCEYCFGLTELQRENEQKKIILFLINNLQSGLSNNNNINYLYWKTYINIAKDEYFVHGMGQGQILSLLTRYNLSDNKQKLNSIIIKVSNSYLVPFNDNNGFVNKYDNNVIFEEYPKYQNNNPSVLNGWIYSLLGLYDYIQYSQIHSLKDKYLEEKKQLFKDSIKTLQRTIDNYNINFWSLYNQPKKLTNICSIHYQTQHIVLLEALFNNTNIECFKNYSNKFKNQYYNPFFRFFSFFVKLIFGNLIKYKRLYKNS